MKRIITLFLALSVLMSMMNVAFATERVDSVDGDMDISEGGEIYIQTKEDQIILKEKLAEMTALKATKGYIEGTYNAINVPVFQQENIYYCGPATVKQILHFLNGSSETQLYYAGELGTQKAGTDMTKIDDVLRNESSENYVYSDIENYDWWTNRLKFGIDTDLPAVLDINTIGMSAWPYHVEGHFINTSGYDYRTGSKVRITDPYWQGLGNVWYNAIDVFDANAAHSRHAMIW